MSHYKCKYWRRRWRRLWVEMQRERERDDKTYGSEKKNCTNDTDTHRENKGEQRKEEKEKIENDREKES